jgi:protein phosphatase
VIAELDDDDTMPTENTTILAEIAATFAGASLTVTSFGAATTPGLHRRINEDAWGARDDVFVIADGMGGRGGGALAARTAIDGVLAAVHGSTTVDWRGVIGGVNQRVIAAGREHGIGRLGSTLLLAVVAGPLVTLVHVGDSRAYRLTGPSATDGRRSPRLDLLTHDHNVRSELLAAGLDVGEYRDRGVAPHGLTSYIGLEHEPLRIDVLAVPMRSGDRLLLCTDGIHRPLPDEMLRGALQAPTCREAAQSLVATADDAGGRDNATAVVLELGFDLSSIPAPTE